MLRATDPSPTLAHIRATGVLRCGIDIEEAEYTTADDHGNRAAFDNDLCRAVAVAVLGKDARTKTSDYPDDRTAMQALVNGDIDIIPTLTDDFTHSVGTHVEFSQPVVWDGIAFLVPGASTVLSSRQLSGKKICLLAETAVEENVRAWFSHQHLAFVPFPFQEEGEMQAAFSTGNCGALAGDRTHLAQTRAALAEHHQRTRLLPGQISNDPLAAAYRDNDSQWAAIVNWVIVALIQAEESGVTEANIDRMHGLALKPESNDPTLRFLLGGSHEIGTKLGLGDDWVVDVIKATGNYGEIYARDLGASSPMKLPREINNLQFQRGLAPPIPLK